MTVLCRVASTVVQQRRTLPSFFNKMNADRLWKSMTSLTPTTRKRGGGKFRKRPLDLARTWRLGDGKVNTSFPGLNTPLAQSQSAAAIAPKIVEPRDLETLRRDKWVQRVTRIKPKVHPLLRGYSGTRLVGRMAGTAGVLAEEAARSSTQNQADADYNAFQTYVLHMAFVSHGDAKLKRIRRMRMLVATGNGKGLCGYAYVKCPFVPQALRRATAAAMRKLQYIDLFENRTIYQDFFAEKGGVKLFVSRRERGHGLSCHRAIERICKLIGIRDLQVKVEGNTKNYIGITEAFFHGLLSQETHQDLAERKRLHVVEISAEHGYRPIVRASPQSAAVRTADELDRDEVLAVEQMYGEGRYPFAKLPEVPFYEQRIMDTWTAHLRRFYRFRNTERKRINLLADGVVPNFTERSLKKWRAEQEALVASGERILPQGLALSDVIDERLKEHGEDVD